MNQRVKYMKETTLDLPIFPLPVFLLPGGMTRLRIFEPRYLKMVKVATQGYGFVIRLKHQDQEKSMTGWGSWVEIINFDQGKDGVLEIDVKCKAIVDIQKVATDNNNLNIGTVCEIPHWSQSIEDNQYSELGQSLTQILMSDSLFRELYSTIFAKNINWVVARWLEILPVNLTVKSRFVSVHNYHQAKGFVQSIINNEKNFN